MPVASGKATSTATIAMQNVPASTAAIPKSPASGFQASVVTKAPPAAEIASEARIARKTPISDMIVRTRMPAVRMTARNTLS